MPKTAETVRKPSISKSKRAGVVIPVGRLHRFLRKGNFADRIGSDASPYLASILEYLIAEIMELSGNACRDNKKLRIVPRHILLAIKNDEELSQLLKNAWFANAGVMPHIEQILLPKSTSQKKTESAAVTSTLSSQQY